MSTPTKPETPQHDKPSTTKEHEHPKKEREGHDVPSIHHKHAVIHPAQSEVTHVDPGAIVF